MTTSTMDTPAARAWMLVLAIAVPLGFLFTLGQDSNWDLQNYHLYGPHAWLQGRTVLDIAPAQLQGWHNPLLDVPLYLMVRAGWHGAAIGIWLTLPFMVALYFLLRLQALVFPGIITLLDSLALALLASAGAAAFAAIGTTFNDAFVAAGVVTALYFLVRPDIGIASLARWCLAGVVLGATAGLKLTAAVYCLGLAFAAMAVTPCSKAPSRLLALLLGGVLGIVLTYGYWGWHLYQQHGNPVFPYFNQFFHSPDALREANTDLRFRPGSIRDALLVPIRLLDDSRRYSEINVRDPRLLLGVVAFGSLVWRRWGRPAAEAIDGNRIKLMAAFFFASMAIWAMQYGIYRYVLALEMLACLALTWCLARLPQVERLTVYLLVGILFVAATHSDPWGRTRFSQPMIRVSLPTLPVDAMVVLSGGAPVSYAVTQLPDHMPAVSIYNNLMSPDRCTALQARAEQRIMAHQGSLWLLRSGDSVGDDGERLLAAHYGLKRAAACYPVPSSFGDLKLCQLHRGKWPTVCAQPAAIPGR